MYRTIDAKFWTDPKVRKLSAPAKLLFLYLITNGHGHASGAYYLPLTTIHAETGLPKNTVEPTLDTLSGAGFIRIDKENQLVWVKNMMGYQSRGDKANRSAAHNLHSLHNSFIVNEFLERYPAVASIFGPAPDRVCHRVSEFGTPNTEQEQEQEQEKEQEQKKRDLFETFWNVYPSLRKQGKGAAREAFAKAVKKIPAETIVAAAEEYAASPVGSGQFVKGPVPWLNQECWSDDRAAWNREDRPAATLSERIDRLVSGGGG